MTTTCARSPDDTWESSISARAAYVAELLRSGKEPTNLTFDEIYPAQIREISSTHWTPVTVAVRVAKRLASTPGVRVLDIGAGAGKFCTIGALVSDGDFHGIEQRASLVSCARETASLLGASNATFSEGLFDALSPLDYDAFYLFNPFGENLFSTMMQIDATVVLTRERFSADVRRAQEFLGAAKPGARVATYNGLGGDLPCCYTLVHREDFGCGIDLWVKDLNSPALRR